MAKNALPSSLVQARDFLYSAWGEIQPHACLVCGSGWGEIIQALAPRSCIPYDDIIGLGPTTVSGHAGNLWLAESGGQEILLFQGRRHFYEDSEWGPVILPVLLAYELGVRSIILTNASGGIREDLQPGDFMILCDHINLMGSNPLLGVPPHPAIPRFPDQSQVYCPDIRKKIHQAAKEIGQLVKEGIYLSLSGPAFETPAEILAYAKLGADAVGMSTVPEAMVANALGLQVGAISCITNLAAGRSKDTLSHEDVCKTS